MKKCISLLALSIFTLGIVPIAQNVIDTFKEEKGYLGGNIKKLLCYDVVGCVLNNIKPEVPTIPTYSGAASIKTDGSVKYGSVSAIDSRDIGATNLGAYSIFESKLEKRKIPLYSDFSVNEHSQNADSKYSLTRKFSKRISIPVGPSKLHKVSPHMTSELTGTISEGKETTVGKEIQNSTSFGVGMATSFAMTAGVDTGFAKASVETKVEVNSSLTNTKTIANSSSISISALATTSDKITVTNDTDSARFFVYENRHEYTVFLYEEYEVINHIYDSRPFYTIAGFSQKYYNEYVLTKSAFLYKPVTVNGYVAEIQGWTEYNFVNEGTGYYRPINNDETIVYYYDPDNGGSN